MKVKNENYFEMLRRRRSRNLADLINAVLLCQFHIIVRDLVADCDVSKCVCDRDIAEVPVELRIKARARTGVFQYNRHLLKTYFVGGRGIHQFKYLFARVGILLCNCLVLVAAALADVHYAPAETVAFREAGLDVERAAASLLSLRILAGSAPGEVLSVFPAHPASRIKSANSIMPRIKLP